MQLIPIAKKEKKSDFINGEHYLEKLFAQTALFLGLHYKPHGFFGQISHLKMISCESERGKLNQTKK